jgi:hypothetical protein
MTDRPRSPGPITALVTKYREHAATLRTYGAELQAALLERVAGDIERAKANEQNEALTVEEAAAESHYSRDHIARLVRLGAIENVGRKGAPRIRRGDLPHRAPRAADVGAIGPAGTSLSAIARDAVASKLPRDRRI